MTIEGGGLMSVVRDIAIVILAVESIIIGVFLTILIFQVRRLLILLEREIKPILESAKGTVNTAQRTTKFVSDAFVSPLIRAASFVSAVRSAVEVLVGWRRKRR
jgi:hypothetical protein